LRINNKKQFFNFEIFFLHFFFAIPEKLADLSDLLARFFQFLLLELRRRSMDRTRLPAFLAG
jgi:hypothetical protein